MTDLAHAHSDLSSVRGRQAIVSGGITRTGRVIAVAPRMQDQE
ncbi:MAG: hypothetical protein ABW048_05620 [Sphingobium sp.]